MLGRLSLTARLTALYTVVSACILVGLGLLVSITVGRHFVELDRDFLRDKTDLVQTIVSESSSPEMLAARLDELLKSHHGLFVVLRKSDQLVYGEDESVFSSLPASVGTNERSFDWVAGHRTLRGLKAYLRPSATWSVLPTDGKPLELQIALDTAHHNHFMQSLRQTLMLYLMGALLVSGLLGWWAARRGLEPLRIMKERAMAVTAQNLGQRMPVETVPVEFADLAQGLNNMLGRLQADFARLQEFSSDLAHELRTPINNLLTQTQVSLAQKRDAEAYRDILASNAEEFQRLARMVSDMLFLAKTENGIELPSPEAISLGQEVLDLFDFYDAVADEKRIRLKVTGDARVMGDRLMVRRAISNLLSNALRHSPTDAEISVAVEERPDETRLCITNSGMTIAPEVLPRLFDRFFREDKSRSHPESDGTGLGLSITQAIMAAHGGSVSVTSIQGQTTFCLGFRRSPVR
ncbi:heavy metal sensor histidine kinase [Hydrogenophaga sp. MI9]|uniref:heavy metal sensor histidine kinase n=1 Tax=Hydrogenophaga sp. MI9 TaxID=3453719 RepID=UPI003EE9D054